tara:strand:- start:395 stop:514 length:120 start_codon:yes stop_codon:yes gene_type:complete
MIDTILQSDIKWDAVVAVIIIIGCFAVSIYNLWNNNTDS